MNRVFLASLLLLLGCPSGDDDDSIFVGDDDDATWRDPGDDDAATDDDDSTLSGGVATLQGVVTRAIPFSEDGIGDLYISAFPNDPTSGGDSEPIAFQLIEGADLSDDTVGVAYTQEVPVRSQVWYILAIFDDDGSGLEEAPGPGDLMSLGQDGAPSVLVDVEGAVVSLDLVLSLEL